MPRGRHGEFLLLGFVGTTLGNLRTAIDSPAPAAGLDRSAFEGWARERQRLRGQARSDPMRMEVAALAAPPSSRGPLPLQELPLELLSLILDEALSGQPSFGRLVELSLLW